MNELSTTAALPRAHSVTRVRTRHGFFTVMAAVQLLIVLTGFAPTLYLRRYFHAPQLPWYLAVHGMLLTAWFALLLLQPLLIGRGRLLWHRRLGVVALAVAMGVVASSIAAAVGTLQHPRVQFPVELPQPTGAALLQQKSAGFFNTAGLVLIFSVLVTAAIVLAHKAAIHKRLMLIASAAIVSAAAFRWTFLLAGLGVSPEVSFAIGGRAGIVVSLLLIAIVAVYDKRTLGRVLPVTVWGAVVAVGLPILAFQLHSTPVALEWVQKIMHTASTAAPASAPQAPNGAQGPLDALTPVEGAGNVTPIVDSPYN
jgi:hypothetical protein